MDLFKKLVLLSSLLALASCNETISPELQQGGVVTPPGGGVNPPVEEYQFKLTNTAAPKLKYLLHKTGAGNKAAKCEITSATPFSKSTYKPTNDITCFLEAEELALYNDGLSFEIEASPKTCEFVMYRPFSYYNRIPGDSTGSYEFATCSSDYTGTLPPQGCGRGVSTTNPSLAPFPIPDSTDKLCRFNHNDKEKCDIGTITVVEKTYSMVDDGAGNMVPKVETAPARQVQCGGKVRSCVQGPYTIEREQVAFSPSGGVIYTYDFDEKFTKKYEYPGLVKDRRDSTYVYANYRRNLANYTIAYGEDDDSPSYKNAFTGIKDFHSQVATSYALDGMNALAYHGVAIPESENNLYTAVPFAADPFMGLYSFTPPLAGNYNVQPFYSFECLDGAREVKARIRMVIRDWDRLKAETPDLAEDVELISDIFRIPEGYVLDRDLSGSYYPWARQDINEPDPDSDIPGRGNLNNFDDWDDIVKMRYVAPMIGSRGFIPVEGFFSKDIFPNENLEKDD